MRGCILSYAPRRSLLEYSSVVLGLWGVAHLKEQGKSSEAIKKLERIETRLGGLERDLEGIKNAKSCFKGYEFDFSRARFIIGSLKDGRIFKQKEFEEFYNQILQVQRQVMWMPKYSFA